MTRANLASPHSTIGLYCHVVSTLDLPSLHQGASLWVAVPRVETLELTPVRAKLNQRFGSANVFVPEGQHDSSQARSAWSHEEMAPSQRDD